MGKPKKRLAPKTATPPPGQVTATRLPVVRCAECGRPLPHQPGQGEASRVLTGHYNAEHAAG